MKKRGRKPIDFTGVDLTRPDIELMRELGCKYHTIWSKRKATGVKRAQKVIIPPDVAAKGSAKLIAAELNVPVSNIYYHMRKQGLPVGKRGRVKGSISSNNRFRNTVFDWSIRDTDLCKPHGCTREYIRQLRKKAGEPASGSREWVMKYHYPKTSQPLDT